MESLLIDVLCLLSGMGFGYWTGNLRLKRPKPFVPEDRNAGLARYQDMKNGG